VSNRRHPTACGSSATALGVRLLLFGAGSLGGCAKGSAAPVAAEADAGLPADASLQRSAEAQGLAFLKAFLRPYLDGQIPAYRGTLKAHDNQGVLGPPPSNGSPGFENQSLPEGSAIAALSVTPTTATLTVHSLGDHEYLILEQDKSQPGVTSIGIILPDTVIGGNSGLCTGCVPSFRNKPEAIDIPGASGTSSVDLEGTGQTEDATLHTYASANLELAEPSSLTFQEIAELNAALGVTFVPVGSEWEAELSGVVSSTNEYCAVPFTLELYVSSSDFTEYGVRDVELTEEGCLP
jgi:hypothetical protein